MDQTLKFFLTISLLQYKNKKIEKHNTNTILILKYFVILCNSKTHKARWNKIFKKKFILLFFILKERYKKNLLITNTKILPKTTSIF